jgi:hypothetical protein
LNSLRWDYPTTSATKTRRFSNALVAIACARGEICPKFAQNVWYAPRIVLITSAGIA